ncbi:MAG: regulatory iron-sulfur-containing complex subunit RicT [Bacteroidota bacterium]
MSNEKNEFFTRGCSHRPKLNHKNDNLFSHGCCRRNSYDWLGAIKLPAAWVPFDFVEVRFKNSRKDFFKVPPKSDFVVGDIVAVEASPGHDIGIITLTGETTRLQMKKKKVNPDTYEGKKVYRKARPSDLEKWMSAVVQENTTMVKSKRIVQKLNLQMKMNDVEFQGDNTKAIFYYTAEERVDFRELIKVLAEEFGVRIEMKQVGVRQEASSLGGLGTCGRELCCSSWLYDFKSVSTHSARVQQISVNPQKLAGQCSKLKCCLNYEFDTYLDASRDIPSADILIKTKKGTASFQKADVFKKVIWYSYVTDVNNLIAIPLDIVKKIIADNAKGIIPDKLEQFVVVKEKKVDFENAEDALNRFDHRRKK